jgi:hypothetical protein
LALRGTTVLSIALLLAASTRALGQPDRPRQRPGEVIVTFADRVGPAALPATAARIHGSLLVARTLAAVGRPRTVLLRFPKEIAVEQMLARLQAMPEVLEALPNRVDGMADAGRFVAHETVRPGYRALGGGTTADPARAADHGIRLAAAAGGGAPYFPNDPNVDAQRGFYWMEGSAIWPERAPSPLVALVGSGVDSRHPELVGSIVKGTDWVNADADPDDDYGFGTHLAGIVAAKTNNQIGIAGLSNGKILAIKVQDTEGFWTEFDYAAGVLEAANNPLVKVVLIGIGGFGWESNLIRDAVETAVSKGKLVIAPAGDDNSTTPTYPGYYADFRTFPTLSLGVISVAATGLRAYVDCPGPGCYSYMDDTCKSKDSNYGAWVNMDAPGEAIYSTLPTHPFWHRSRHGAPLNYGSFGGTPPAAAQVAAAAARALSVMPRGTTATEVKFLLEDFGQEHVFDGKMLSVDTDGDGTEDTPCQPADASNLTLTPNMRAAMGRTAVYGYVYDAHGGIPLPKAATVTVTLDGAPKGYGGATSENANHPFYGVINLPFDNNLRVYEVKVAATGYTAGAVAFYGMFLHDCDGYVDCTLFLGNLSLPRNLPGQIHVVTDFDRYDLDTHLFTPSSAPLRCDVGISPISSLFCFLGSLTGAPFARLLHDGGPGGGDDLRSELLSIKAPLYSTASGTPYRIILTDYDNNYLYTSGARTRIWAGGRIIAVVSASAGDTTTNDCTYEGGANTCGAFWVGDLSGAGVFTRKSIYGTLSATGPFGVLPYGAATRPSRGRTP